MRWWGEYDDELDEMAGYPNRRNLPDPDQMTEGQFRDSVLWARTHLDGWRDYPSPVTAITECSEDAKVVMNTDEISPPVDAVKWPQMTSVLRKIEKRICTLRLLLAFHLNEVQAADLSQTAGKLEILANLELGLSQSGTALRTVEKGFRNMLWTYDELTRQTQTIRQ